MQLFGYEITTLIWYFIIYSFLGWCVEVVYCTVNSGRVENRGFLDGPVCPIYGWGMLLVILLIRVCGYQNVTDCASPILFFGGMILASSIELLAGWIMMKLFHMRWWDYSQRPFNIGGYICLQFSLAWGLASLLTVKLIHIPLTHLIEGRFFSGVYCLPMLAACALVYLIDLFMTVRRIMGINRSLERFEEVSLHLHEVSEELSQKLGTKALEVDQRIGEERVQGALAKAELMDHSKELRELAYKLDSMKEAYESHKDAGRLAHEAKLRRMTELEEELEAIFHSFEGNRFLGIRKIMHIQRMRQNERVVKIWNWHIRQENKEKDEPK